jgi:hypothetical protein
LRTFQIQHALLGSLREFDAETLRVNKLLQASAEVFNDQSNADIANNTINGCADAGNEYTP